MDGRERSDASEDLRAELARTQARYKTLVEQIPAVLYEDLQAADGTFTSTYVGPQIATMLGITPESYLHSDEDQWLAHLHPEDRDRAQQEYQRAIAGSGELLQEYRMVLDDGRVVWIRDQFTVIDDEAGGPTCIQGVMFDITELKSAQDTAARQLELLQKVDVIGRAFTDLVLEGASLAGVLETLQEVTGAPVVLEDGAHQIVELAVPGDLIDDVVADWGSHSRSGHAQEESGATHDESCWWITIQLRDRPWGRLHVLAARLDEIDQLAIDRAAAAVALTLHSERHVAHLADHERGALLSDIWAGRYTTAADVLRRADRLGADLSQALVSAMVIEPAPSSLKGAGRTSLVEDRRQQIRSAIVRALRTGLEAPAVTGLSTLIGDRGLAIIGTPDASRVRVVADLVLDALTDAIPDATFSIGLSRAGAPDTLRQALSQADEAAAYGLRGATRSGVHAFEDLGIHHLLRRLSDGPELAHFVESQLQPLLDHDADSTSPLLPTLEAFLANGGRKAETARVLHLERRSLYYRLERIEVLLSRDLGDQEVRVQLEIAVRGLEILRQRRPTTP